MKNFIMSACIASACLFVFDPSFAGLNYTWNPASGNSVKDVANLRTTCGTPGTVFPTSADTLVFNGTCSNANCVLDTTLNLAKINVRSSYSGSITISGSITLTFIEGVFLGGSFNGGSVPITFTESLRINGTNFVSTEGMLSVAGTFTYLGGSFTHNNGTVLFKKGSETTSYISGTSNAATTLTLYKAEFAAPSANTQFTIRNITVVVTNEMKLTGSYQLFLNTNASSIVEVQGNIISSNTASVGGGSVLLLVNGTGSQSINDNQGASISGKLPNIEINKPSGTLSLYGSIGMGGSTTLEYVAGTISAGTSRLLCYYNNTVYNNSGGSMTLSKMEFIGSGATHSVTGKVMVTDTFSTSSSGNCVIDGDTLELQGNMVWNNTSAGSGGSVVYKFSGSAEQIISGAVTVPLSKVRLKKTAGDIALLTSINISSDLKFETGFFVSDTINWVIFKHGSSATGASENSFVKGTVKKIGNSAFVFPVGKDTIYNPVAITAPTNSIAEAFTAEYFNFTQPHGFNKDSLTYLSPCEYWNVQRTTGSSNVKVTLNWNANTCDIYTLTTLRIARWDGTKWSNTGPVTTTGNTTAGTIQTNSNQSAFGDFIIAKRSPVVTANAGSDATINLGSTATLGGSPAASGGVSPYTYTWFADYALSSATSANPTAKPFSTFTYYLKVTDTDLSVSIDSVKITVNGFDLKSAARFPLLTDDSLITYSPTAVVGAVGIRNSLVGTVTASDSVLINTSTSNLAIRHLDTAIQKIDALSASSLTSTLDGQTVTEGVYRISSNATLDGTLTFQGNLSSYIVIDINGNLTITDGSEIFLDGLEWNQVYIRVHNLTISGEAVMNGIFLLSGTFNGSISEESSLWLLAKGTLKGNMSNKNYYTVIPMTYSNTYHRDIDNFFGINGSNVTKEYGFGDTEQFDPNINEGRIKELHARTIRFPGGSDANWWRWQSGWFRGYNNPLYNSAQNPKATKPYGDDLPMPSYCDDGLPWDFNSNDPMLDHLLDFKKTLYNGTCFPMFDLNMLSSDAGSEIGGLFYAHCQGVPVKYIELGNEFAYEGIEAKELYPTAIDYFTKADAYSGYIKSFFPDAKIAIVSTTSKFSAEDRRNNWNNNLETYLNYLDDIELQPKFDALTFHIYPSLETDKSLTGFPECNLNLYEGNTTLMGQILSTPFSVFDALETTESLDPQKEFEVLEQSSAFGYDLEGWITEYNQEEDHYNFHGRWAHGLFTATMTLRAMQYGLITKATCFELIHGGNRDVVFDNVDALETNDGPCDGDYPAVTPWEFGAAGKTLRYIGLATQNALSARTINFSGAPEIEAADDDQTKRPGIYGWVFSNVPKTEPYSVLDSNWAVILNLTDQKVSLQTKYLFALGGEYVLLRLIDDDLAPYDFIYDAANQLSDETPIPLPVGPFAQILIPKYSLLFIRGGNQNVKSAPVVKPSTLYTCVGNEVTLFLSATGANTANADLAYTISPDHPSNIVFDNTGSSFVAKVTPISTTKYTISVNGSSNFSEITINTAKASLINAQVTGSPDCPGTNITLDANGVGDLLYNWYPSLEGYDATTYLTDEIVTVNPVEDITYTVNATGGTCFCAYDEIFVNMYDSADAGPDIYVCNDLDKEIALGGLVSYPDYESIAWTENPGAPELDPSNIAQPIINGEDADPAIYTYTLSVTYPDCILSDEADVHIMECCDGEIGDLVFDPFADLYDGDYLTTSYLWDYFQGTYADSYDENCGGPTENVDAILDFPTDIIINGLLIVDKDLAFINCSLKFGPDAKVIINPNNRLLIISSSLQGCDDSYMWQGIQVTGNLNTTSGLEITQACGSSIDSYLADAIIGVLAEKDSRITIKESVFDKNFAHIAVSDYRFALQNQINGNQFEKTGPLLSIPYFLIPFQPLYGIYFEDVPQTGKVEENDFNDCNYGIYALQTGLNVSGGKMLNVINGVFSMDAQNNQTIADIEIHECKNGIWIQNTGGYKTTISSNDIITLAFTDNNLTGKGIYVTDIGEVNLTIGGNNSSFQNTIHSNSMYGILLSGFQGGKVEKNEIILKKATTGGSLAYGIRGESIEGTVIDDNDFRLSTLGSLSLTDKRAISLTMCNDVELKYNSTDDMEIGFEYLNTNLGLKTHCNEHNNHEYAWRIGDPDIPSLINNQIGSNGKSTNNKFFDVTSGHYHLFQTSNGPIIQYNVASTDGSDILDSDPPDNNSSLTIDVVNDDGLNPHPCDGSLIELNFDEELAASIINNDFEFPEDRSALLYFNLKSYLYKKLRFEEELLEENEDYFDFIDTTEENSVGRFRVVNDLLYSLYDTSNTNIDREAIRTGALSENDEIDDELIFETNQKVITLIYLNTIAKRHYGFSAGQKDTIESIAGQCAYTGGKAVFTARMLMRLYDDTTYHDDRVLCDTSNLSKLNNVKSSNALVVKPNPAIRYTYVNYTVSDLKQAKLYLMDSKGENIYSIPLNENSSTLKFDLDALSAGIYFFKLEADNLNPIIKKLVIVR